MRNPFRWIFRNRTRRLDGEVETSIPLLETHGVDGQALDLEREEVEAVEDTPSELELLREEIASLRAEMKEKELATERARREESERRRADTRTITKAIGELRAVTVALEKSIVGRIDQVTKEVAEVRAQVTTRTEEIELRLLECEERDGGLVESIKSLADSFDRQLARNESTLASLREACDSQFRRLDARQRERLEELEAVQKDRLGMLERERRASLAASASARERLDAQVRELSEWLQAEARLPVPDTMARGATSQASRGRVGRWLDRFTGARRREDLFRLELRTRTIESHLQQQAQESARRGRLLLETWSADDAPEETATEAPALAPAPDVREDLDLKAPDLREEETIPSAVRRRWNGVYAG